MVNETSFAETVSRLTKDDIFTAARRCDNGIVDSYNKVASQFLSSISTSYRPLGYSNEARDKFGAPSPFFTR